MKNLYLIFLFLILVSCSTTNKKVETKIKEEIKTTTATRILPEKYIPGKTINVEISVNPSEKTTGVIVEEKIPEKWEIINSEPNWIKKEGNTYKYLFYGERIEPFKIKYQVKIPEEDKGEKNFEGCIKTFKEGTIIIGGNSITVSVK